ncbi:amidohydrolase [Martelella mediterranea]|uniref:amidohydrolase family protein n=1 Tax=Martelella mediterranea TaxID=293089 RepID=UPI001E630CDE|nr:amidohydrolase family protein [Martelella mediterranea]MCD1636897.1 amidohydrolase [Martelella mediterranea]
MNIVDTHPHIVSEDTDAFPISPIGGKRSEWSHKRSVTAEQLIEAMDEAGVAKAAIVHSSTTYGFNCDYVADAISRYSDRLTGVFSVNVTEPDGPEKMQHWIDRGFTGMRLYLQGSTMKEAWVAMDDKRIYPCYELAAEAGLSVATNLKAKNFGELETVMTDFPTVNFFLDHLGGVKFDDGAPFEAAAPLWALAKYPNLYIKLVTGKFLAADNGASTSATMFAKLVEEFGADRLAWGSNFPSAEGSYADVVKTALDGLASLPQDQQDWIMGKTAQSLYPTLKG